MTFLFVACAILVCGKWSMGRGLGDNCRFKVVVVVRGCGIAVPCHGQDTAAVILQSYKLAHPCPSMVSPQLDYSGLLAISIPHYYLSFSVLTTPPHHS